MRIILVFFILVSCTSWEYDVDCYCSFPGMKGLVENDFIEQEDFAYWCAANGGTILQCDFKQVL